MTKEELRQWIIEFAKAPAYPEVIDAIDIRIEFVIAQAIAEHEQSKWKKYPENKPEHKGEYLVEVKTIRGNQFELLEYNQGWLGRPPEMIIAFRELPKPYQEGGEK